MDEPGRLGWRWALAVVSLMGLTVGLGLGSSARLTYHEAFVAQAAREVIAGGSWLVPTIDGRPWLEKPPLPIWLVAGLGWACGGVSEAVARAPSAIAAAGLALGVAVGVARRSGPTAGVLAGLIQATTAWTVLRGRLAEADVELAGLIVWSLVAFDRVRDPSAGRRWRLGFFTLLGILALVKGLGFGAVLVGSVVGTVLIWDRDRATARALLDPAGWALAALIALAWPVAVAGRLPAAISLWTLHVADRLASHPEHFVGDPWWQYGPAVLLQGLPWTPLAAVGAVGSLRRARSPSGRGGFDRLLWAWLVAPVAVLSLATVKNAHYAIHALPPLSAWAASGLLAGRTRLEARGWSPGRLRRGSGIAFAGMGLLIGVGHLGLGPRLDRKGAEWAWLEGVGRTVGPAEPIAFLYEDWDRKPYPTPFGPVPHDWAIRLFSLDRPAGWRQGVADLERRPIGDPHGHPAYLVARGRDLPALRRLGRVEVVAEGPTDRWDRAFTLYRLRPGASR